MKKINCKDQECFCAKMKQIPRFKQWPCGIGRSRSVIKRICLSLMQLLHLHLDHFTSVTSRSRSKLLWFFIWMLSLISSFLDNSLTCDLLSPCLWQLTKSFANSKTLAWNDRLGAINHSFWQLHSFVAVECFNVVTFAIHWCHQLHLAQNKLLSCDWTGKASTALFAKLCQESKKKDVLCLDCS